MNYVSFLLRIFTEIVKAWQEGRRKVRTFIVLSALLILMGGLVAVLAPVGGSELDSTFRAFGAVLAGIGAIGVLAVYFVQKSKAEVKEEKQIEAVETRARENPKEPQVAWELARRKLESYLNRNLSQVRLIFLLTVAVMTVGFSLIGVGAYQAFRAPDHFKASVLSSVSGVLVSFIGGTFLVLYKSTMAQAKDYVTILERINAVGMSVQILEGLPGDDNKIKNDTKADVAIQLLHMYSAKIRDDTRRSRTRARSSSTE